MKRIGVDVGGTNTDAVLIDGDEVLGSVKMPTSADVTDGVTKAINRVLETCPGDARSVGAVMIGTTHFTNAVVERSRLQRVAAIRIALPASASLLPFVGWPAELVRAVDPLSFLVRGGHEFDGRPLVPLDRAALREAAMKIRDAGITAVGITSLFSPLNVECEVEAGQIVASVIPDARITLSSELGRIGLLERENVTLLNAALQDLGGRSIDGFTSALRQSGVAAPLYITQNDGTIALAEVAAARPVSSFASGPTNSLRGAAFLTGRHNALVIDVGGTTSDIGCLVGGFPREANNIVEVGGVRTLFRMPDILALALGGGTIINSNSGVIGPRSVGFELTKKALVFGGDTLTVTDIAVAAGLADIGDRERVRSLDRNLVSATLERIKALIEDGVDRMKISAEGVELLAVGGGAFLVPERLQGVSQVVHVEHAGVANALGAAMAQVSGEVDQIFSGVDRDEALSRARETAAKRAVAAGASAESLTTIEVEDFPIAYLSGSTRRVRVRVVGDIATPDDRHSAN